MARVDARDVHTRARRFDACLALPTHSLPHHHHSGGGASDSRFLIQLPSDAGFLDGRYEAFGRVSGASDVLVKIERVAVTGTKNKPVTPVAILAAGVLE